MPWSSPAIATNPTFSPVAPIVGSELAYVVDDSAPALVYDADPISVVDGSGLRTFSAAGAPTDVGRQFNTVGPFVNGDYTDFVLSVDESHPIYLSETALPYILLQEVMTQL